MGVLCTIGSALVNILSRKTILLQIHVYNIAPNLRLSLIHHYWESWNCKFSVRTTHPDFFSSTITLCTLMAPTLVKQLSLHYKSCLPIIMTCAGRLNLNLKKCWWWWYVTNNYSIFQTLEGVSAILVHTSWLPYLA